MMHLTDKAYDVLTWKQKLLLYLRYAAATAAKVAQLTAAAAVCCIYVGGKVLRPRYIKIRLDN